MTRERRERILGEGYLDDLADRPTEEIRAMRAECEAEEEAVSYARRLVQGRLDILRAELVGRREAGEGAAADLLERLPAILAADQAAPSDPLKARATRLRRPEGADDLEAELDRIVDTATLARLDASDTSEVAALAERLAEHEGELSEVRRALFGRIDALRDELARRYKDGTATVGDLFTGTP